MSTGRYIMRGRVFQGRAFAPWALAGGSVIVEEPDPDFLHGWIDIRPHLSGKIAVRPHLSGSVGASPHLIGDILVNS